MLFKKKTSEDYKRERTELYKERSRLLKQQAERSKHQERVNYRIAQTKHLKKEIKELKYGKYKTALKFVGNDLSRIAKPIGRGLSTMGRKIATPTQADKERIRQGKSITYDYDDILGTKDIESKKKKIFKDKFKNKKDLFEGMPD